MALKAAIFFAALMAAPCIALPKPITTPSVPSISDLPLPGSLSEKLQQPEIEIIKMGVITETQIQRISSESRHFLKRQDNSSNSDAQGPFADLPQLHGDTKASGEKFSVDGPFSYIEAFVGDKALRGLILKNLDGKETVIGTVENSKSAKRPGSFEFGDEEIVTDCTIDWKEHFFSREKYVTGFHFGTNKDHRYNATSKSGGDESVAKFVGSGYPVRFHGIVKNLNKEKNAASAIVALGIEFLDELRSIDMVSADYAGFEGGVSAIPDDGGKSLIMGTQILDNRNSTINQTFQLTNSRAVTKSFAFTFSVAYMAGASITLGTKLAVPLITEATVSATVQWSLSVTSSTTLSYSETISQGTFFALTCPALKFCQGRSVFQTYDIEVPFDGQFQATTRRGDKFAWNRKGVYKSSDVSNMKLQVNVWDAPPVGTVGKRL
ncbi:hypothetical protein AOL_s00006g73 [Orbilia oligospora ATCC 24927]|uniref:Jacalin-type lectin domain-containing protein n=1 Tax=Arthrobotrys oligospora (strain ATCC 24927 / CBS 115.81 / DSM 1491) TaxID=756982 RepID=G1WZM2_ARTOA|nr:hypothetical protein AOL_s00006g73 [Orbilia oligospora ATCC 24927]EGX53615.1 hypothetical protein AOL_s00006g73 [Orbilia oligospora ATCC 24927]